MTQTERWGIQVGQMREKNSDLISPAQFTGSWKFQKFVHGLIDVRLIEFENVVYRMGS